jgi:hypothetical protein
MRTTPWNLRARAFRSRAAATLSAVGVLLASIGLVTLTAPAASAHTTSVDGDAICQSDGTWMVTWTITNNWTSPETLSGATRPSVADDINNQVLEANGDTLVVHETVKSSDFPISLYVLGSWEDRVTDDDEAHLNPSSTCSSVTEIAVPAEPMPTPPTCDRDGSLTLPDVEGVTWSKMPDTSGPGTYDVTATTIDGYTFPNGETSKTWTNITVLPKDDSLECLPSVTPTAPDVDQAVCTGPGESSEPSVTLPESDVIDYSFDETTGKVTATVIGDNKLADALPDGWTKTSDTVATYTVEFTEPGDCQLEADVAAPTFVEPTCEKPDRAAVKAKDTDAVDFTTVGDIEPGGSVIVTAVPESGYYLPEGFTPKWTHTFSGVEGPCVKGTESTRPKPDHEKQTTQPPTVRGTQSALPTAVDAGIGGPEATSAQGGLLAQLMVASGLLLLLAGGWLGFGRRESGAHGA